MCVGETVLAGQATSGHLLLVGVGADWYMSTSGQGARIRYSPISVHELRADSACTTSVEEGGPFQYSFWTISVHEK